MEKILYWKYIKELRLLEMKELATGITPLFIDKKLWQKY